MGMLTNSTPSVDAINKERNRLKQEQNQIQNNIKKTINSTEEQIRKLKNKIDVLENKKKTLIIEFNKECDKDDKIRGTTPPQIKRISSPTLILSPSSVSPKSRVIDRRNKDINNINTQLENDRLMKMIEATMTNKINQLNNKIELQEKERKLEIEKKENSSNICSIM